MAGLGSFDELRRDMTDNILTVLILLGLLLGVPVALLVFRDRFQRPSKKGIEEYSRRFTERLRHPDFAAVERHFGRPLPSCVQALYANHEELLRGDFETAATRDATPASRWYMAFYQPADGPSVKDAAPGMEKYFAFADDGCGNGYWIDPTEEDPAVLFHDHETGEVSLVCRHFTKFMRWPRWEATDADQ